MATAEADSEFRASINRRTHTGQECWRSEPVRSVIVERFGLEPKGSKSGNFEALFISS